MGKKYYCGLFIRDCYLNIYLIKQNCDVVKKTYPFSKGGILLLKNILPPLCDIGIISYDSRAVYSLFFMEKNIFFQQGKRVYVLTPGFLNKIPKGSNVEQIIAVILSYENLQNNSKSQPLSSAAIRIPSSQNQYQYTDGYVPYSLNISPSDAGISELDLSRAGCIQEDIREIDIYGTCLSFTTLSHFPGWLKVKNRIQQQSVLSVCTPSVEIDQSCIIEAFGHMDKSDTLKYFNKSDINEWKNNSAEYILLDLMIERDMVGILNFDDKYVTYAWTLAQSHIEFPPELSYMQYKPIDICEKSFYLYLKQFSDLLKSLYKEKNIIIHKGDFSSFFMRTDQMYYMGESGYNQGMGERLNDYYNYLEKCLPEAYIIDVYKSFASRNFINTSVHLAHYQQEFYETVAAKMTHYIQSSSEVADE